MRLNENRVKDDNLHDYLTTNDPWGDADGSKFIGRLVLDEWLAEDRSNVAVYAFDVQSLINDFIEGHIIPSSGYLDASGAQKARVIIADMESMIATLKSVLPR